MVKLNMIRLAVSEASAAPAISIRGNPNQPKMKIGSRIAFRIAATVMTLPSSAALPRARIAARQVHITAVDGSDQYQIDM